MIRQAKKAFYLGVCAAAVTKRFVEAEVNNYLKSKHITEKEGKKIVDDAMKMLETDRKAFEAALKKELNTAVKRAKPLVKQSAALAEEIAADLVKEATRAVKKKVKKKAAKAPAGRKAKKVVRKRSAKKK